MASASVVSAGDLKWESAATRAKVDKKVAVVEKEIHKGSFKDDWNSLRQYQIPDWYQDAKFGIFMHWGLYSVPGYANEWYSRNMYQQGDDAFKHHVAVYGPQNKFGYKDFAPLFTAEKFDPAHWAKVFKEAGAQYVIPVAEHHDGFAMYDSDFSRWTAKKMGPKRDVIGELAKAVRAEGLVFGLSSHRAEHWWFMSGGTQFDSDVQDPRYADFYGPARKDYSDPDDEYMRNWLARSAELVDKYHPQVVYFDWWIGETPVFAPYLKKFAAYYYDRAKEWGEGVVLNTKDKAFVPGTAVQDVEKGKLPGINPVAWQTDTSVSWRSWAFLKDDQLKDSGYLIRTLIDAVSKNGNLLLDIGPAPDGTIPEGQEKILLEIGGWLKVNGEAIYGTRPWIVHGEGPTQDGGGKFSEKDIKYQEGDVRFTRKGNTLYILSMVPPTGSFKVTLLGKKSAPDLAIKTVTLLGSNEAVTWERDDDSLRLSAPEKTGVEPVVYKVELTGALLGGLNIEMTSSGFAAGALIQNYDDGEAVKEVDLLVDGKKVSSKQVTVGAQSTVAFELPCETSRAGLYRVSLLAPNQPTLSGQAVLPAIDLSGEWLFKEGDDPSWSKTDLDDSSWKKVKLPAHWADHGYNCEYCYGWYRRKVFIPVEWKGHSLEVPLGKIDDTDASYWNGVKIGQTGEFPPKFQGFWDKPRKYSVPEGAIRFGRDNVIAIRVYNGSGGAGLYDGPLGPIEVK
jgi:alpha-L-fucosidase